MHGKPITAESLKADLSEMPVNAGGAIIRLLCQQPKAIKDLYYSCTNSITRKSSITGKYESVAVGFAPIEIEGALYYLHKEDYLGIIDYDTEQLITKNNDKNLYEVERAAKDRERFTGSGGIITGSHRVFATDKLISLLTGKGYDVSKVVTYGTALAELGVDKLRSQTSETQRRSKRAETLKAESLAELDSVAAKQGKAGSTSRIFNWAFSGDTALKDAVKACVTNGATAEQIKAIGAKHKVLWQVEGFMKQELAAKINHKG